MPKYGIHHIVLDEAIHQLKATARAAPMGAGYVLEQHRDAAMLGAIGPDLFFWAPDYEAVRTLYPLYKNMRQALNLYDAIQQGVKQLLDLGIKPVTDTVETLLPYSTGVIKTVVEELAETARLFQGAIQTSLLAGVAQLSNVRVPDDLAQVPSLSAALFQSFVPGVQHNLPEAKWYWFEMLHYRNTGAFARSLVANARTDQQRAYAYGYLSHIATDLVGHGFVNQIVGGPYRLHVQRHITVENFMDAWAFWQTYGVSINQALLDRLALPQTLPTALGSLLDQAFHDAYGPAQRPVPAPAFLARTQIDQTYEVFYDVLKLMSTMTLPPPKEPFSGLGAALGGALGDFLEGPPLPPQAGPGGGCTWEDILAFGTTERSRTCYDSFFREAAKWFEYLGELIKWTLDKLVDLVDCLVGMILTLPAIAVLSILYAIQQALYEIYRAVRSVLVLPGFICPEPDELKTSYGRSLLTTYQCCPVAFDQYPRWTDLSVSNLVCPPQKLEFPTTAADFCPSSQDIAPSYFMGRGRVPFEPAHLRLYAQSASPLDTRTLQSQRLSIGTATDLTAWMISTAHDPAATLDDKDLLYTDWNLDADRGYGYKAWQGDVPSQGDQWVANESWAR